MRTAHRRPHHQPTATAADVVAQIEGLRRTRKWSASRIAFELRNQGVAISRRTVSRHLVALGLNRRRFIDPCGKSNRTPRAIVARRPAHMVHVDVKKVGRIPDGGGWRVHGKGSVQAKAAAGARAGYVYLHSAVDGYSRLAYAKPSTTKRQSLQSDSCIAPACGSPPTASTGSNGSSLTTVPVTEPTTSHTSCTRHLVNGSRPTPPQREGGALQPDPGRGVPHRADLDLRGRTRRGVEGLEHPLQLPSAAFCHRRPATRITTSHRRHQRHGRIQTFDCTNLFKSGA